MQIKEISKISIGGTQIIFGFQNRHEKDPEDFTFKFLTGNNKQFWLNVGSLLYLAGTQSLGLVYERLVNKLGVGMQDVGLGFSQEKQIWIANIMEFEEEGVSHPDLMIFLEEYLKNYINFLKMSEDLAKTETKLIEHLESLLETHFVLQYKGENDITC